jgi:hypothetical protein
MLPTKDAYMINKTVFLSVGNALLYLVTCVLIGTGLLLEWRMDEEDRSIRLLGMGTDDWGEIHQVIAISFVALSVIHLVLNWPWIKGALRARKLAAAVLIAGVVLAGALLLWPVQRGEAHVGERFGDSLELVD